MADPSPQVSRLIVFAKIPVPGQVKTRLGETVGTGKSAALYRTWVPSFIETLQGIGERVSVEVCVAPEEEDLRQAREWLPYPVEFVSQEGTDLGERLKHAFDRSFEVGWGKVLILGSDSPQLTEREIESNLALLETHDAVLGPAEDGGYYAIGLTNPPNDLFKGVRWSDPETFADTERAIREHGLTLARGPISYDLDTLEDLNRLIDSDPLGWSSLKHILETD